MKQLIILLLVLSTYCNAQILYDTIPYEKIYNSEKGESYFINLKEFDMKFLEEINKYREEEGSNKGIFKQQMYDSAVDWSYTMATTGNYVHDYNSHISEYHRENIHTLSYKLKNVDYDEIIKEGLNDWKNSKGHNECLLGNTKYHVFSMVMEVYFITSEDIILYLYLTYRNTDADKQKIVDDANQRVLESLRKRKKRN